MGILILFISFQVTQIQIRLGWIYDDDGDDKGDDDDDDDSDDDDSDDDDSHDDSDDSADSDSDNHDDESLMAIQMTQLFCNW